MQKSLQLIASRNYPFLDSESLEQHEARDTLFRFGEAFLLHMSAADAADRLIHLDARAALAWINATAEEFGMEWT